MARYPHRSFLAATLLAVGLLVTTWAGRVAAHEGPPFPLRIDEPLGEHIVSVWADPDIGEAKFFVVVEPPSGGIPDEALTVSLWAEPVSGRLERVQYSAERQLLRNRLQFEARPYFDQRDMWTIGVQLRDPDGQPQELTMEVESTPPGFGPWDLAIYLFPFLLIGGLWVVAMFRRRAAWRGAAHDGPHGSARDNGQATTELEGRA